MSRYFIIFIELFYSATHKFSYNLDYSMTIIDLIFMFTKYLLILKKEIWSYGFGFDVVVKQKSADTNILLAFLDVLY